MRHALPSPKREATKQRKTRCPYLQLTVLPPHSEISPDLAGVIMLFEYALPLP